MLVYKINVLESLKGAGYSTYRIMKDQIFPQSTVQKLRDGEMIGIKTIDRLCELLRCQPGDIIEYRRD